MSTMTYLFHASAAFLPGAPPKPMGRPPRAAVLNGSITGSTFHIVCFSHSRVGAIAKPFCTTNHFS